jgi:hypothetical protein
MGSFQVCDALSSVFNLEKPPVKHLKGFVLLSRKDGELLNVFRTLNQKFQLKNSKEFPHKINKS